MYGMVLMAAVSGSADVTAIGHRDGGGCGGAIVSGGCFGYAGAGCNGKHHGGGGGLFHRDRGGCDGGKHHGGGHRDRGGCNGGGHHRDRHGCNGGGGLFHHRDRGGCNGAVVSNCGCQGTVGYGAVVGGGCTGVVAHPIPAPVPMPAPQPQPQPKPMPAPVPAPAPVVVAPPVVSGGCTGIVAPAPCCEPAPSRKHHGGGGRFHNRGGRGCCG